MIGDLEQTDGGWQLRFTRHLRHAPDLVWRAITEAEQLEKWFPDRVVGEWKVGATLRFESRAGDFPGFDGEVIAIEYPSLLVFRWGTDVIRLEIAATHDGCVLTLVDTIDQLGKAARDGAGWHVCLDDLEHALDRTKATGAVMDRWGAVHRDYQAKFGPEASTIGPPEALKR